MRNFKFSLTFLLSLSSSMTAHGSINNNNNAVEPVSSKTTRNQVVLGNELKKYSYENYDGVLDIDLPGTCWVETQAILMDLIERTIADPTYENRSFSFSILGEDWPAYYAWMDPLWDKLCIYPVSLIITGLGYTSEKKANGYNDRREKLTISNATLKEKRSRESDAYRIYQGKIDCKLINEATLDNVLVRAHFTPEELHRGQYHSSEQRAVFIKPELLDNKPINQVADQLKRLVFSNLRKAKEPFVVLVFNLHAKSKFTAGELLTFMPHGFLDGMEDRDNLRATLYDDKEKRIYYCFNNILRKMIDLHGLTPSEAKGKVNEFIHTKHDILEKNGDVMTGMGNHVNTNGSRGVLKAKVPEWLDAPGNADVVNSYQLNKANPAIYNIEFNQDPTINPHEGEGLPFWFGESLQKASMRYFGPSEEDPEMTEINLRLSKYARSGPKITYYRDGFVQNDEVDVPRAGAPKAMTPKAAPTAAKQQTAPKAAPKAAKQKAVPKGAPKAARQQAAPKGAPTAAKQQAAPKAAPKAAKQQAAPKAATKAAKAGPVPKVEHKVAPKKQGGKK